MSSRTRRPPHAVGTLILACWLAGGRVAAECDIYITGAYACDKEGRQAPMAGEAYYLVVEYAIKGAAARPYEIHFEMANLDYTAAQVDQARGRGLRYWWQADCPLDGEIPWRIVVDPDNQSADVDPRNNVASGSFEPRYPEAAIQCYAPQRLRGWQRGVIRWQPGSGTVDKLFACFAVPQDSDYQRVLSAPGPEGSRIVTTDPHGMPVYQWTATKVEGGKVDLTRRFEVEASRVRVNPHKLRLVPWSAYHDLPEEVAQWSRPEKWSPCDAPQVKEFVAQALPADYRTTMQPYDALRKLHLAVMNHMDYAGTQHPVWDALQSLEAKRGNCGNVATLTVTVARAIGVPARTKSGWGLDTTDAGHSWTELYFPGAGWVPVDTTWARSKDPEGRFAYYFGVMPHLNGFIAVTTGIEHRTAEWELDGLITPFFWTGTAKEADNYVRARVTVAR